MQTKSWLLLPVLLLAGCAQIPQVPRELSMQDLLVAPDKVATPTSAVAEGWWRQTGPSLAALIEQALQQSPQRQQVLARLDRAAAYLRETGQARLPAANFFASSGRERDSDNAGQVRPTLGAGHGMHRLGLSLDYDIDYLQRHARAEQAALLNWQAARQDARQLDNILISNLAIAYLQWQQAHHEHALQQRQLQNRHQLLQMVRDKAANGLESRTAIHQAEARWHAARAILEQTAALIDVQRLVLLSLSGQADSSWLQPLPPDALLTVPLPDAETLTLDRLGQRPDILAARLRIESGAARVAVARAGFYPNLRLSLLAGLASSELDTLDQQDARFGAAGISLSLPVFRSAQLQGDYLARYAEQHQAIADYHRTVLDAIREWRTAQRLQQQAAARQDMLQDASRSARAALDGASERYRHGLGSLLEVLQAEDAELASESQALQAACEQAIQRVHLIRALGGGIPAG